MSTLSECRNPTRMLVALAVLLLPPSLGGQEPQPCSEPVHAAFDFWVGEWEVLLADGSLAGHNTIRKRSGGCNLVEEWRGASGSVGQSLNYVDPADGRWHQLWVDNGGLVLRLSGGPHEGGMRMEGTGPDTTRIQRITWTPMEDGRVRQLWEESGDQGETWTELFDGSYRRLPTAAAEDLGSPACDTPEGRRFDFWPGEWRVSSRLRGPDGDWWETEGVWRAVRVLDGCGYLDSTTGDYGPAMMSGVGSRFYDPEADEWTVTWTSTQNPGEIGVWRGLFGTDGVGEFYRDLEGPGPVRSRIRWTNVGGDTADWDFSVLGAEGEEWRVLWEMSFSRLAPGSEAGMGAMGEEYGSSAPDGSDLMEIDRRFSEAVAEGRSRAWAEWFAEDGAMVREGVGEIRGRGAIREAVAYLDRPGTRLRWEPRRGEVGAAGDLGWTTGTYVFSSREPDGTVRRSEGVYVTVWRRSDDGSWKVVMDLGVPR